ncbi:MAG: hypothetical protein WKG01_00015 [Kofleriaceae bacterium]
MVDVPQSGSRLKLAWTDFAGTRLDLKIHDSVLGTRCAKQSWVDGRDYCTPAFDSIYQYADAQCTQGAVDAPFAADVEVACGNRVRVARLYRTGPPQTVSKIYTRDGLGNCVGEDFTTTVRITTTAVTNLVELTMQTDASTVRLAPQWLVATDGLRLPTGVRDTRLDVDCAFDHRESEAATDRCLPAGARVAHDFADANCESPGASSEMSCPPITIATRREATCEIDGTSTFRVGEPSATTYERINNVACTPHGWSEPIATFPIVRELPPVDAPTAIATTAPRISPIVYRFGDRERDSGRAFDNVLDVECKPVRDFATSQIRCVPDSPAAFGVQEVYTDASCQTPPILLLEVARGTPSCPIPNPGRYVHFYGRAYQVGEAIGGPLYLGFPSCRVFPDRPWFARFRATQMPLTAFALGSEMVAP